MFAVYVVMGCALMANLFLDTSGKMRDGCFYRIDFVDDDDLIPALFDTEIGLPGTRTCLKAPTELELIKKTEEGYALYGLKWPSAQKVELVKDCPTNPDHARQQYLTPPTVRLLLPGKMPDLSVASLESNEIIICSKDFAARRAIAPCWAIW